jgi:hypothetical protein
MGGHPIALIPLRRNPDVAVLYLHIWDVSSYERQDSSSGSLYSVLYPAYGLTENDVTEYEVVRFVHKDADLFNVRRDGTISIVATENPQDWSAKELTYTTTFEQTKWNCTVKPAANATSLIPMQETQTMVTEVASDYPTIAVDLWTQSVGMYIYDAPRTTKEKPLFANRPLHLRRFRGAKLEPLVSTRCFKTVNKDALQSMFVKGPSRVVIMPREAVQNDDDPRSIVFYEYKVW